MNEDLKIIKKKYGEKMAHLCRDLFPSLLETEGLMPSLMTEHFAPNHSLYEDITCQGIENEFKNYIYSLVDVENNNKIKIVKSPEELLSEAGYILYECNSEKDIQKFKKYYAKGEELCTFKGFRLKRCHVFFAVKKNVADIKREDFTSPQRQDAYGTSVISIQFTKDDAHTLSIKNRYNHHVNNPDSTFANNLDNIIEGLTDSFARYYGLEQKHLNKKSFEIDGYVLASDGKFYKYNQELNGKYYCPDNIIIDHYEVKRYDKEKYIIFDYFILDLVKKEIKMYWYNLVDDDSFLDVVSHIERIEVVKKEAEEKEINLTLKDKKKVIITLNKHNQMIELECQNVKEVSSPFLKYNMYLKVLKMPDLQIAEDFFLNFNLSLQEVYLPKLKKAGDLFLSSNEIIKKINLNSLEETGEMFLGENNSLIELDLPNLKVAGDYFLCFNETLKKINVPKLQELGSESLNYNISMYKSCLQQMKKSRLKKIRAYLKLYIDNYLDKRRR